MTLAEIHAAIPHRPPFLLVDEILERGENQIHCRKTFNPDEYFYAGHYPDYPITPGVLLCEAAMQAGAILLASIIEDAGDDDTGGGDASDRVPVATRMNQVRFKRVVRPGDTIDLHVELTEQLANAYFLRAKVTCGGKVAVTLDFACTLAPRQ